MRSSLHDKIILFDHKVFDFFNNINNDSLTKFFKIITHFGDIYIPCIILIIILIFNNNRWLFLFQTLGYGFSGIVTYIAKISAARPRPTEALIKIPSSYSFPSGHTLTSIVFYVLLFYLFAFNKDKTKRHIIMGIGLIFAFLIAISRIYLGVHYFSDVVGAFILAIPCLLLIRNVIHKNFGKNLK
jgi:undecaprenyl-diphosphatase